MRKLILLGVLAILLFCGLLLRQRPLLPASMTQPAEGSLAEQVQNIENELELSISSGANFTGDDIEVTMAASQPDAEIYYTLGGGTPSVSDTPYTGPFRLKAGPGVSCVVVRAVAVLGGAQSPVVTQSFFLGQEVDDRFSTLVFSLSTDDANLYGEEAGILYDDGTETGNLWQQGPEWERPVSVEVFTAEGQRVVAQNAGLRVHGYGSRANAQKSLRIVARSAYDDGKGRFDYPFFPEQTDALFGAPITSCDALVLRTAGGDMLRDELALELAKKAGYVSLSPVRPAAVYLNGEYYGFVWLHQPTNEHLLEDLYVTPERHFGILDHLEIHEEWLWFGELTRDDITHRLTDDATYETFCQYVDVDDLLLYYALQVYLGNEDWPHNNYKMWKYTSEEPALRAEQTEKWRYLLYDFDMSMRLHDGTGPRSIETVLGDEGTELNRSDLLRGLLRRPDVAARFANTLCDLAFTHATEESAQSSISALLAQAGDELRWAFEGGPGQNSAQTMAASQQDILTFFKNRPDYILPTLREYFGYTDFYRVRVDGPARINTVTTGEGRYFVENPVTVYPNLAKHEAFVCWELNGQRLTEEALTVTAGDAVDGVVSLRLITEDATPELSLRLPDDPGANGCAITNNGAEKRALSGLYLTDDPNRLDRWAFPNITILPGRTMHFAGASQTSADGLLKVALDFNITSGETLILSDENGTILDYIVVP